jgi:hypothetical protein
MTYKIQIDDLVRDANEEETAFIDAQHAASKARDKAQTDKAKAKQAVLDRLGITSDEAALLLG